MKHSGLNPSHELALYAQAALYARQLARGVLRCAYCLRALEPGDAIEIDHIDGGRQERRRTKDTAHARAGLAGAEKVAEARGAHASVVPSDVSAASRGPRADLMVVACGACNAAAGTHDDDAWENLRQHLMEQGARPEDVRRHLAAIAAEPLPDRNDPTVVDLAERYFSARLQREREDAARRRGSDPSTAGTGATRAHRVAKNVPF